MFGWMFEDEDDSAQIESKEQPPREEKPRKARANKSIVLAYILWFFLPGVHRLYLGRILSGFYMMGLIIAPTAYIITVIVDDIPALSAEIDKLQFESSYAEEVYEKKRVKQAFDNASGSWLFVVACWAFFSLWWIVDFFKVPGMCFRSAKDDQEEFVRAQHSY